MRHDERIAEVQMTQIVQLYCLPQRPYYHLVLACGHSLRLPAVTIVRQQLFVGKSVRCADCAERKRKLPQTPRAPRNK